MPGGPALGGGFGLVNLLSEHPLQVAKHRREIPQVISPYQCGYSVNDLFIQRLGFHCTFKPIKLQ